MNKAQKVREYFKARGASDPQIDSLISIIGADELLRQIERGQYKSLKAKPSRAIETDPRLNDFSDPLAGQGMKSGYTASATKYKSGQGRKELTLGDIDRLLDLVDKAERTRSLTREDLRKLLKQHGVDLTEQLLETLKAAKMRREDALYDPFWSAVGLKMPRRDLLAALKAAQQPRNPDPFWRQFGLIVPAKGK